MACLCVGGFVFSFFQGVRGMVGACFEGLGDLAGVGLKVLWVGFWVLVFPGYGQGKIWCEIWRVSGLLVKGRFFGLWIGFFGYIRFGDLASAPFCPLFFCLVGYPRSFLTDLLRGFLFFSQSFVF